MPAGGVVASGSVSSMGGSIPFVAGSNWYREKVFTDTYTVTATGSQEFVHNITPGGFLRGVRLFISSTGGVIGSGTATADNPWSLITSATIENIDGSPILYPMGGYAYYLANKYFKPWKGDPAKAYYFASGINPKFVLDLFPEIRDTAGVLANTDARALYRVRYTIGAGSTIATGTVTTWPTVTVVGYMEAWSQPDSTDLHGNSIAPVPPGLNVAHILRHQIVTLNNAGADNIFQLQNVGNEIRGLAFVVRDSNNARQDYLTDPIRARLDNRSLDVSMPDEVFVTMSEFYDSLANGTSTRETGVYVYPRFRKPGSLQGQFWLPTSNATYLTFESATSGSGSNLPGTVEIITDEVIPLGPVPAELEGC